MAHTHEPNPWEWSWMISKLFCDVIMLLIFINSSSVFMPSSDLQVTKPDSLRNQRVQLTNKLIKQMSHTLISEYISSTNNVLSAYQLDDLWTFQCKHNQNNNNYTFWPSAD